MGAVQGGCVAGRGRHGNLIDCHQEEEQALVIGYYKKFFFLPLWWAVVWVEVWAVELSEVME